MAINGRHVTVTVTHPFFLEGTAANDEAVGCVYYVALDVDAATDLLVNSLRAEIGLAPLDTDKDQVHLTVAGVAPNCGGADATPAQLAQFRREWCPPAPSGGGRPAPLLELRRNLDASELTAAEEEAVAQLEDDIDEITQLIEEIQENKGVIETHLHQLPPEVDTDPSAATLNLPDFLP